jgi:hypothetical protein
VCNNSIVDFNTLDLTISPPIVRGLTPLVDLLDFPSCALNIEAILVSKPKGCNTKTAKCVQFFLDGVLVNKEKFTPFTYFKNRSNGTISQRKPPIGNHTIKACTYSDKACTKDEGGCKETKVQLLDCNRPTPSPTKPPLKFPTKTPVKAPATPPIKPPVPNLQVACNYILFPNVTECLAQTTIYYTMTGVIPTDVGLLTSLTVLNLFSKSEVSGT